MKNKDPNSRSTFRRILNTGVTYHNQAKAEQGYILFSPLANLNKTLIIDMNGEIVHEWKHDSAIGIYGSLTEDGNLFMGAKIHDESWNSFGIWPAFKGGEIREVKPNGEVIWSHKDIWHHHDQRKMPHGGALYMSLEKIPVELSSKVKGGHSAPDGTQEMYADVLIEVDKNNKKIWEWHAKDHLDPIIDFQEESEPRWEWSHGNTIVPLGDDRVIVSFRAIHTIGIIEKSSGKWLWKYRDPKMGGQHDPHLLENGNILVYDNGTQRRHMGIFPYSKVFEINPKNNKIEWVYEDKFPFAFYSPQISGARRLPGGNTLICEGLRGRIFQITPQGEVVWEYVSPFFGPNVFGYDINMVFRAFFYTQEQLSFIK